MNTFAKYVLASAFACTAMTTGCGALDRKYARPYADTFREEISSEIGYGVLGGVVFGSVAYLMRRRS